MFRKLLTPSNGIFSSSMMKIYVLLCIVCLSKEAHSVGSLSVVSPMTMSKTSAGGQSKMSYNTPTVRAAGLDHSDRHFGRITMSRNNPTVSGDLKLHSKNNLAMNSLIKPVNKLQSVYDDTSSLSSIDGGACEKNSLKASFDIFMNNFGDLSNEQSGEFNQCDNIDDQSPFIPNILKDLINFAGHLVKADWRSALMGSTLPYVSLMQRIRVWSKQYNGLQKQLVEERKNNPEKSVNPVYIAMQMTSIEMFKFNYIKFDETIAEGKRAKHINEANGQAKEDSPSLISSDGNINLSVLDGLFLNEDYLMSVLSKVIKSLEADLLKNQQMNRDYQKENGQDVDANAKQDENLPDQEFKNCLEQFSMEEQNIVDRLESFENDISDDHDDNIGDKSNNVEQSGASDGALDGHQVEFNQAMARLARIAKNELISTIKNEITILAQFYLINSIGFGDHKKNLEEAYLCSLKTRLLNNGFFYLMNNTPGMREFTGNTVNALEGACSRLMGHGNDKLLEQQNDRYIN